MVMFIIASEEAWSEPYAIVGNVIGYSTIIFSLMKYVPMIKLGCTSLWLHRNFTPACCPNIAPSCRLEFALAGKGLMQ